jgi:DNA-directed RNA polymerase subunit M
MLFCPKCSSILVPSTVAKGILVCSNCSYRSKTSEDLVIREKVKVAKNEEIAVVEKNVEALPKTQEECPKCNYKEAYFWTMQTRAGDEAETRFFECVKCKHRWRAYK